MSEMLRSLVSFVRDLVRPRLALALENAFLRKQLDVLSRDIPRRRARPLDRLALVVLSRVVPDWRETLRIVRPETLVCWHRRGFRVYWARRSRRRSHRRRLAQEVRDLIVMMAKENPSWGAKRIVGELAKLEFRVHKRTVARILRRLGPRRPSAQAWRTFVRNHLAQAWACDFFTVTTHTFRQLYVFFVLKLETREVVHFGVTEHPTAAWFAQQLREATAFGDGPEFLVRDRDNKFGAEFDAVAEACGTRVVLTPPRTPVANAFAERLVGTLRRECLDHMIVLDEEPLRQILAEFVEHYNRERPHQGIGQRIPSEVARPGSRARDGPVVSRSVLGGLVREYRRAPLVA